MKAIIMNKRIVLALGMMVFVAALLISSTGAFFSDSESSVGNVFTAGDIDLKIDSTATYNGNPVTNATWTQKDLVPQSDKFFNFNDVKPGDQGENTISVHVTSNDAWVCAMVSNLTNDDNGINEPESAVDTTDGAGNGELAQSMNWIVWRDDGAGGGTAGNNIQDGSEATLTSGHPANGVLALYDSITGTGPLLGNHTGYIGVKWELPATVGNEVQTDSMTGDVSFSAVQSRNNPDYKCVSTPVAEPIWVDNGTRSGGTVSIVDDNGTNVLRMTTTGDNDSRVRWTNMHLDFALASLTGVDFDSKQVAGPNPVVSNASMRLFIDLDGNTGDSSDVTEVTYEPYYNISAYNPLNAVSIMTGVWEAWHTTLANGKFWANGNFMGATPGGGAYATNFTLQQVSTSYPSAKVVGISFGLGTYNVNHDILVKNLMINGSAVSLEN